MSRICIIHIGMHKTGTSSIQRTLFRNRHALLNNNNVEYFGAQENHGPIRFALGEGQKVSWPGILLMHRDLATAVDHAKNLLDTMRRDITANRAPVFVLSGEGLSLLDDTQVAQLRDFLAPHFDRFEIHIYVRDPYTYASSAAQETLKYGFTFDRIREATFKLGDDNYNITAGSVRPAYKRRIATYQKNFGKENVRIHEFAPGDFPSGDVVQHFMRNVLGLTEGAGLDIMRLNESWDDGMLLALEALNRATPLFLGGELNPQRAVRLSLSDCRGLSSKSFEIPDFDWERYAETIATDVAWLAETTSGRISFQTAPPAGRKQAGSPDLFAIVARLNRDALAIERHSSRAAIFRDLWRLSVGNVPGDDLRISLRQHISRCREPDFLLNLAFHLRKIEYDEIAVEALDNVLALADDEALLQKARRMRANLKYPRKMANG